LAGQLARYDNLAKKMRRKRFFFEKKNQKTFFSLGDGAWRRGGLPALSKSPG